MDYHILVNKENGLNKTYVPSRLVDTKSKYKDNILIDEIVLINFNNMREDALKNGLEIDIMSGYRDYFYQEKLYNRLLKEKGYAYTFRSVAKPGFSEHQTGLAVDICVYKDGLCYIEHDITSIKESDWLINNAHKYGFILRYPKGKEDITGYNYEPWHYRYVGSLATYLYENDLTLEEYKKCEKFLKMSLILKEIISENVPIRITI